MTQVSHVLVRKSIPATSLSDFPRHPAKPFTMSPKIPTPSRPFRILALPLARLPRSLRPANATTSSSRTPLLLFQVLQPDVSPEKGPPPVATRALRKASDTWMKLGDRPKDSWMYWFYARGEGLMDRIEYEEWALKGVTEGQGLRIVKEGEKQEKIQVRYLRFRFDARAEET